MPAFTKNIGALVLKIDDKDRNQLTSYLKECGVKEVYFFEDHKKTFEQLERSTCGHILFIDNKRALNFDYRHFLSNVKLKQTPAYLLGHGKNSGGLLAQTDLNYQVTNYDILPSEFYDGFRSESIYLFDRKEFLKNCIKDCGFNWISVQVGGQGIPSNMHKKSLYRQERKSALFLDRDGIINYDDGYVHKFDDLRFIKEGLEVIKLANELGMLTLVLTNQSGVARGKFEAGDVHKLHEQMSNYLKEEGLIIDGWYSCPYYYEESSLHNNNIYNSKSILRKPMPGMVMLAQFDRPIDINRSYMIGDKISDEILMPGLSTVLVEGDYDLSNANCPVVKNHRDLLKYLKNRLKR